MQLDATFTAASPGPDPQMSATVSWYYRPEELEVDAPLPVFKNEVFAADERATHPLNSVCGRCEVLPPTHPQAHQYLSNLGPNVYICSRKYVPSEG